MVNTGAGGRPWLSAVNTGVRGLSWLSTVTTGVRDRQEKRPIKSIESAESSGISGKKMRENRRDRSEGRVDGRTRTAEREPPVTIPPPSDF